MNTCNFVLYACRTLNLFTYINLTSVYVDIDSFDRIRTVGWLILSSIQNRQLKSVQLRKLYDSPFNCNIRVILSKVL